MKSGQNLSGLEEKISYRFSDSQLLQKAMVHASRANEKKGKKVEHNERLEFLGDAVLQLVVSEYLYKEYPKVDEGTLTKMRASVVNEQVLAQAADQIDLGQYIQLGKGEERSGGRHRPSLLADTMEALIGALFLDSGLEITRQFILSRLSHSLDAVESGKYRRDYKTTLQELIQKESGRSLQYHMIAQHGPDHDKEFDVQVESNGTILGTGTGKTKKDAEQAAAKEALSVLQKQST